MEIVNIEATKLSKKAIQEFLGLLNGKYGFFDMYHNYGPAACFCTEEYLVVIMSESNYSDARGGGGVERNNSIALYTHSFEKVAASPQVNYRHRSSDRYDNYHKHYIEILELIKDGDVLKVRVKTGAGSVGVVNLVALEKPKQNEEK